MIESEESAEYKRMRDFLAETLQAAISGFVGKENDDEVFAEMDAVLDGAIEEAHKKVIDSVIEERYEDSTQKLLDWSVKRGLYVTDESGEQFKVSSATAKATLTGDSMNMNINYFLEPKCYIVIDFNLLGQQKAPEP